MNRGKCSENRKVNTSSFYFFFILFFLILKHLQHTSSLRKAVSSTSISNHLLWTRYAPGWSGQGRHDTCFASRFATRTAFNKWKRGRWNASHLECYVLFLQLTKVSCMGHLTVEKGLQLSVLLPHILIVTCLFRVMSLTILHNSCSQFKYQKYYRVTLLCIPMMWKEKNRYIIVPLEQMKIIPVVACCKSDLLLALISPPFFPIPRCWKHSQNTDLRCAFATFCCSGWRQYNSSIAST